MPGLVRKFLIFAAVDGLILQPLQTKGQKGAGAGAVKVGYKGTGIGGVAAVEEKERGKGFEAFGIVGLLTVSTSSYLISITRREQVAQIHGKPIYVITEVALTPLASQKDASASVATTAAALARRADGSMSESESESEEEEPSARASGEIDDVDTAGQVAKDAAVAKGHGRNSSIAEDVMTRKGGYGRFAQKWFSRNGWTADRKRGLGMSVSDNNNSLLKPELGENVPNAIDGNDPVDAKDIVGTKGVEGPTAAVVADVREGAQNGVQDVAASLLPKLLRTTHLLFGSSRSFYFSYDYDITRSFTNRNGGGSEQPLYKDVDPLFFWNRNVIQPFIDAGQAGFVLPLLQGFVGQLEFAVELHPIKVDKDKKTGETLLEMSTMSFKEGERPMSPGYPDSDEGESPKISIDQERLAKIGETRTYLMTLISRRSVKRGGLRYLRRGVDGDGNTANSVETEQILSSPTWSNDSPAYSFLQIRGSIPLFFSQSPYSFKPIPQMQHSTETNFSAFKKHFGNLAARYGALQVATLVEKHGTEEQVGEEYEKHMTRLNEEGGISGNKIGFEWFDFHAMCRGMKFENVSILTDTLGPVLDGFSHSIEIKSKVTAKQSGVLRTNCMDCLDRTNVVQSACGRRALEIQLKAEGIEMGAQKDQTTQWFNTLWADNGDAISKQYASTAALKGDFTRTRKRNYTGALTDMGLSISRFYSGIVNDYFSQAAIDFLLGNVTSLVFDEFSANMMSSDPSISMPRMRQQAIEVSHRLVVADESEEMIGGWALLTPHDANTVKSMPFEESVLLLTDKALYACRFDWNMEKVSSFERVDLRHVKSIKVGTYITSTLSTVQADEKQNVGFVVTFKAGANDITRVNTRSMSTVAPTDAARGEADLLQGTMISPTPINFPALLGGGGPEKPEERVLALKALPARSAAARDEEGHEVARISERDMVKGVCLEIERVVLKVRKEFKGEGEDAENAAMEENGLIIEGDIISLAEAIRATSLLEQLGHSLKKLVWA